MSIDPSDGKNVNGWALASFFLGLAWVACVLLSPFIPEVLVPGTLVCPGLAILLGVIGRRAARRSGDRTSDSMAARGIGMAAFSLLACPFWLPVLSDYSTDCFTSRRAQFVNNLKQVGTALHNYHRDHGRLPPAVVRDAGGRPLYSWRVLILPYLEEGKLFDEFHLDESWDSPHNRSLLPRMPHVYAPVWWKGSPHAPHNTCVQAFVGPGTAFEGPDGEPFDNPDGSSNFPDGLDNTIAAADAARAVAWTQPMDLFYSPNAPLPPLGGAVEPNRPPFQSRGETKQCSVLFMHGNVRSIKRAIDEPTLRALITRNGGDWRR